MVQKNRQDAWKRGQWGERFASLYLRLKGYGILARQFRSPLGEIDIIARRGNTLVFVEVKTRPTHDKAAFAISRAQQDRITRAAGLFIQNNPKTTSCSMRFDAVLISPWRWPAHLKNVW